jgi:hypothetical protein
MAYTLSKQYKNHYGLDLKSTDVDRPDVFASDMLNAQYKKDGTLEKRKGFKAKAASNGGSGLFVYNNLDATTGSFAQELLSASDKLYKLSTSTITVSYAGADAVASFEMYLDTTSKTFKALLMEGVTEVLDYDLGVGFDETPIKTLADLKTAIDGVAGFSAVISGSTSTPAAFLDITQSFDLKISSCSVKANYWTEVTSTITPFSGHYAKRNDPSFENISAVQANNCIYFSTGYDDLMKYDGSKIYRAGMPKPSAAATYTTGAGSLSGFYQYFYTYRYTDYRGNVIEGTPSDILTTTSLSSNSVTLTVNNLTAAGASGFDVSSSNLKIVVYRTESLALATDPAIFYELTSVTNNPAVATQALTADNTADASLGVEYIEPIVAHDLPPKGKYITSFYSQLFISGIVATPNVVYWSELFEIEYFDYARNITVCQSKNGDAISGISQSNEVMAVFEKNAVHVLSGDFVENNFRQEIISHKVGCVAHATIQQVESSLYFLADNAIYRITSGQIPEERSSRIQPIFIQNSLTPNALIFSMKRAVAVNNPLTEKYIVSIPTEETISGDVVTNSNNVILVEDYAHNSTANDVQNVWLKWNYKNTNMSGGVAHFNERTWFTEKRYSSFNSGVSKITYQIHNSGSSEDYSDHVEPIEFSYSTAWYHLGEPSVFKKFIRLKMFYVPEIGSTATLNITTEKDFIDTLVVNDIDILMEGAGDGYGLNLYGVAGYGDTFNPSFVTKLNGKFKAMRIIYSNDENQKNIELTGWELEVSAPFDFQIKG